MGFLAPSPPSAPEPDPELVRKQQEAEERARKEREKEEARKREEQAAFGKGLRGKRSLLSGDFTGFSTEGRFLTPKG